MHRETEFAQRLRAEVDMLGVRHTCERSFKISEGELAAHRFLYGLRKQRLGGDCNRFLLQLCTRLGMPDALRAHYGELLPQSAYVHLGFEQQSDGCLYKAYLEFYESVAERLRRQPELRREAQRMYVAFKWNAARPGREVTTFYDWFPDMPAEDIALRCGELLAERPEVNAEMQSILERTRSSYPDRRLLTMEVYEAHSPRRSLDINFYSTGMRVEQITQEMERVARVMHVEAADLQACTARSAKDPLGHVSCGLNREGRAFITVYHGVRSIDP